MVLVTVATLASSPAGNTGGDGGPIAGAVKGNSTENHFVFGGTEATGPWELADARTIWVVRHWK
jgi:hypothetical protein